MGVIDLRSDFLARPTPEMVRAMTEAAARPGGFGLREDPEVQALEALAAELVGKEDALFCPTCTQANQIAIHLACRPGTALVAEENAHVIVSEAGAPAALSGVACRGVRGTHGVPELPAVEAALSTGDDQRPRASLLVLENTHVRAGGSVLDADTSRRVADAARVRGIPVHLDGSRVFNAAAALGVPVAALTACADTVAFSLNKGLAAPLGAILAGPRALIEEAVRVRQMFGGGWRPAGIPAAAARVALQTMPQRLGSDHALARRLAQELVELDGVTLAQPTVWSNLVLLDLHARLGSAADFAARVAQEGVLVLPFGPQRLRLAMHYEVTEHEVPRIASAFRHAVSR